MNKRKKQPNARTFQLWGWLFFILSALCFMAASFRSGDWLSFLGATFFLLANLVFLYPILKNLE